MVATGHMDVAAMLKEPGGARPAGADDFDWVNAWAVGSGGDALERPEALSGPDQREASIHLLASAFAADAERAAATLDRPEPERSIAPVDIPPSPAVGPTILLRRTADRVPIILGSVIGALMLVVFTIAAMFVRFAR
jgi:hypothetical protein